MTWLALRAELAEEFSALQCFRIVSGFGVVSRPPHDPKDRRARYLRRKATGLCQGCPNEPEPGRATCATCRPAPVLGQYGARVAAGLCGRCGGQRAPGKSLCADCRRKCAQAMAKRRRQKRADLVVGVEGGK